MILLLSLFLGAFSPQAQAADLSVVDIHRNITLAEDDTVYKDFYINGGSGSGLKKNLVVTAVRKINIRDSSGASSVGEIVVPVGQLKVIAVYDRISVAREFSLLSRDELPMLEQIGIMSGDLINLEGAFVDTSKPKSKKKVAENPAPAVNVALVLPPPAGNPAPSPQVAAPEAPKGPAPASVTAPQTTPAAPLATAPASATNPATKVADNPPASAPEKN